MQTWMLVDEFIKLSGFSIEQISTLIKQGELNSKEENELVYIDVSSGTSALIKGVENTLVNLDVSGTSLDPIFVEKTISTILSLHEKVINAKDETIASIKSENAFLKEGLISMQDIYDDDKKTLELLREELKKANEEVEFMKRKYKLMWGKISNSTK
ncbi:hypothetical protein BKH40_05650 [Helicobacter sp. 11S02629-2]|nr:hypothetical protein BKH40_05650 [Helicobacter sp. 11S02629-2]